MNNQERYINNLSRMIKKETVSAYGQEDFSKFREFHGLLRDIFPCLSAVCQWEEYRGSILLRWPGKSSDHPVLFMNHHDVVEPLSGWKHEPFCGEVYDGKLWGRGTLDTKGGLWGMLQAADDLASEGFVPHNDIYFESACCEETTGEGAKHFAELLEERGIRFSYILDEGGMIMDEPIGGAKGCFAMIGMGERGMADLKFIAKGHGGHASAPENDTPLVRLGKFMAEADRAPLFDVQLSDTIKEMMRRLAPSVSGALGTVFAHPDFFSPLLCRVMPKTSGTARALLQTTLAFTMARGSDGRNVIPSEASLIGNMRVSHHQGFESSLNAVKNLAAKFNIEVEVLEPATDTPVSDYNSRYFKLMEKALSESFPKAKAVPYIMTGCSDTRFMYKLSENCFRFVPFYIDKSQMESIHGIDECVDISNLEPAVCFYKYMMKGGK